MGWGNKFYKISNLFLIINSIFFGGCPSGDFTITTNPINSETEEEFPDFCPASEDALGLSPQELAKLQKRLKLRRILPSCITFEDLGTLHILRQIS